MKILFFNTCLGPGGKERRLVELIKGLSANPEIQMELVLTKDNLHYEEILQYNIKIHYILRGSLKKDPSIFFKFYSIANNFKPDIIHVWSQMVALYAIPTKVLLQVPMINSQIADAPENVSNNWMYHKVPFYFSDKIIANTMAGLKSYNAPKNKSTVIYNGFDFSRITTLADRELVMEKFKIKTKFVVGMVATFFRNKDYDSYIKAAIEILKTDRNITFLCVGDGDFSAYKDRLGRDHVNNILFLGKQKNVEAIMNICDIGVLMTNTKNHGEGISNALLEFSALKKPIIAVDNGGTKELVIHNKNGILIKPGDYEELAKNIKILLRDEKLRSSFGENAIQIVMKKFSIDSMIKKYIKVYHEF